jgi:hypothetical protein
VRFKNLDLNLLAALDKLIRLRSVSRAAEELSITQSAMSNALNRLRQHFDDPLLVQVGRRMELTPRAIALEQPVRGHPGADRRGGGHAARLRSRDLQPPDRPDGLGLTA